MEFIFGIVAFAFLVLLGLVVGKSTESRHFTNLVQREQALSSMLVTDLRSYPYADPSRPGAEMVLGETVIGGDYLKMLLASIRGLVGGEIKSLETLIERARREAIARMLEQARARGYNAVCNVRLGTADIAGNAAGGNRKNKIFAVGMVAWGTAYQAAPPAHG